MEITDIKKAAEIIKSGDVVAFPTETVYGLGADATNEIACQKIFKIKGRPSINPLIVHVADINAAQNLGEFNDSAFKLAEIFWPGPLSIVLPLKNPSNIAPCVLAGNKTIALRVPAHLQALALILEAECPVAAPSANPSGYISPTLKKHVESHFGKDIYVLSSDQNFCKYGLESTIVDLSSTIPTILRYGFITPEAIEDILKTSVKVASPIAHIKAPGMLDKHYSPSCLVRLNANFLKENEVGLNFGDDELVSDYSINLSIKGDLIEAARNLYEMLRLLDVYAIQNNIDTIAVAPIPNNGIGLAINDRLKRAAMII